MCLQIILLFVSKIGVFGHFLKIASLDFANFKYCIRKQWYLTGVCGCNTQKNNPKFILYIIRVYASAENSKNLIIFENYSENAKKSYKFLFPQVTL